MASCTARKAEVSAEAVSGLGAVAEAMGFTMMSHPAGQATGKVFLTASLCGPRLWQQLSDSWVAAQVTNACLVLTPPRPLGCWAQCLEEEALRAHPPTRPRTL